MLDLSRKELEANLWLIHTVEAAFSHEPPSGTVLGSLKRKLLSEARNTRKAESAHTTLSRGHLP